MVELGDRNCLVDVAVEDVVAGCNSSFRKGHVSWSSHSWPNSKLEVASYLSIGSYFDWWKMAFQSGTKAVRCFECEEEGKFFKMFQSFRTEHAWRDDEGRMKAVLFCVGCDSALVFSVGQSIVDDPCH